MPKKAFSTRALREIGITHGKRDIERVGLFAECGWLHGVPYVSPQGYEFRAGGNKGKQMLPGGGKMKVGLQDCYFDKGPYKRIFEKEAYSSAVRENYLASMSSSKRNVSSVPFVAGAPAKKHSTPGDYYGTFAGRIDAFSRAERSRPPHKTEKPNVKTNPGKRGTYGFVDITFNKFPVYMPEPYQSRYGMATSTKKKILNGPLLAGVHPKPCFDMNPWYNVSPASTFVSRSTRKPRSVNAIWIPPSCPKMQGNNHDGCFNKYPVYKPEKYIDFSRIMRGPLEPKVFYPQIRLKSMYSTSVVNRNVDFRINSKNWQTFQPITYSCKKNEG